MPEEEYKNVHTIGGHTRRVPERRVIGDTPEHAKHLIWDSHTDIYAESNGGLAFTIGVATIEAQTVMDHTRFWKVCHPNGTELYHVACMPSGQVIVTKVC